MCGCRSRRVPVHPHGCGRGTVTTWLSDPGPAAAWHRSRAGTCGPRAVYARIRDDIAGGTDSSEFRTSTLESRLVVSEASNGSSRLRDNLSAPLLILMGIVGLVLVVACANVANLMLARAAAQAPRNRRVPGDWRRAAADSFGHGLLEALLLAALGGAGGLLLAACGGPVLVTLLSGALPISLDVSPDLRVLAFTMMVSCVTAVVFGLLPALRARRESTRCQRSKSAADPGRGAARIPLRRTLVVTQIAVSLVLLIMAGLFVRSLFHLKDINLGFDPDRVLLFRITPPADEQSISAEERRHLYRQLLARAESVPGVDGASASVSGLFTRETWRNVDHRRRVRPTRRRDARGPSPMRSRRATSTSCGSPCGVAAASPTTITTPHHSVAVINQTFARQFFGDADPIGKRVGLCSSNPCGTPAQGHDGDSSGDRLTPSMSICAKSSGQCCTCPSTQFERNLVELEVRTDRAIPRQSPRRSIASSLASTAAWPSSAMLELRAIRSTRRWSSSI